MEQGATFRVTVPKCPTKDEMPIMSSKSGRLYEAELKTGAMFVPMVHSSQQARMA